MVKVHSAIALNVDGHLFLTIVAALTVYHQTTDIPYTFYNIWNTW